MEAAAPPAVPPPSGGRQTGLPVEPSTTTKNVTPPLITTAPALTTVDPLPATTTTTTTIHTFSDHIITVDLPTSSSNGQRGVSPTLNFPTETPYGYEDDKNTNGGLMLTVSLVVVFVVLAGLILVVFCLFRRRSALARRQMRQLSKGASSSSVLESGTGGKTGSTVRDNNNNTRHSFSGIRGIGGDSRSSGIFLAGGAAGLSGSNASQNGSGIGTPGTIGSHYGASEIDINRALQEMSELHQSHRLSKRSSTLSLGHSRMLSPVMSAAAVAGARPPSALGSGYYSGSNSGTPGGPGADSDSRANSFVGGGGGSTGTGGGDSNSGPESGSLSGPSEFRHSRYEEHYGRVSPHPQPLHLQQQQQQEFMQDQPPQLLGTGQDVGVEQTTDRAIAPAPPLPSTPQVHVHPFPPMNRSTGHLPVHGERPQSMMVPPQSSSALVIPPSITTRRRSMMNTNSMYMAQAGQGPPFIPQPQQPAFYASPPQFYQQQQQQQQSFYPPQPYQLQQYDYVDSPYENPSTHPSSNNPLSTDPTQRGQDPGTSSIAAAATDSVLNFSDKLDSRREEDGEGEGEAEAEAEDMGAGVGGGSPSSSLLLGAKRQSLSLTSEVEGHQPKAVIPSPPQTTAIVVLPDTSASTAAGSSTSDAEMTHSNTIHPA